MSGFSFIKFALLGRITKNRGKPVEVGSLSHYLQGFTIPETNIGVGIRLFPFGAPPIFRGDLLVLRECIHLCWKSEDIESTL